MKMNRRDFLRVAGVATAGGLLGPNNRAFAGKKSLTGARPNIILILADDMGYSDIASYGGEIQTPNLDRLAKNGLRFTQFYNGARCCPTRAALLTGLYAHQTGMGDMEPDWHFPGYRGNINKQCVTLGQALKANGYSTYMSGKWHLTNKWDHGKPEHKFNWPRQRGFDRYYGIIRGAADYYAPKTLTRDNKNIEQEARDDPDYYLTDAISDSAAEFIAEHCKTRPAAPFFSYVAYTAPHWPLHARKRDVDKYEGKYMKGWDVLRKERHERMIRMGIVDAKWPLSERNASAVPWEGVDKAKVPERIQKALDKDTRGPKEIMAHKMAVYAAMIDSMDQGIGRIVSAVAKAGQLDNTLIVFLSDNGACAEYGVFGFGWILGNQYMKNGIPCGARGSYTAYGPCWANAGNTPFRYFKHFVHEGGIATPLIVHWPAGIKAKGQLRHQVGHVIDIMPTFMEVAGAEYPKEYNGCRIKPMEGTSLVPAFDNKPIDREYICWEHHGNRAIRIGKWKLVARGERNPWELYDMEKDSTELNNLIEKKKDLAARMEKTWHRWAKRCDVLPMNPNRKKK